MTTTRKARVRIYRELVQDTGADTSHLEGDRLQEYRRGDFGFCGARAVAEIRIPYGNDWTVAKLKSPGVWGIEDDSGGDYLAAVFEDEKAILLEMLAALHDFELVP